jgi:2-succinyl-5-enolpyruvyl-6-hydroxy-3-cyclohexene-1-carboxylate synthase
MYSDNRTVQILVSLLKGFGVRYAVLSPGTRNVPLVHSLEIDTDFNCYSVVDERSAAYFAIGLALETREPVLISCTSGTAAANYTSAMWEASRQHLPIIAITSDRNPYYLGQLEDQMIDQPGIYRSASRKTVNLPIVRDDKDAWYCQRLVNETLLELQHHSGGPVHINLPIEWGLFAQNFNAVHLPKLQPMRRFDLRDFINNSISVLPRLEQSKRILVLIGQNQDSSQEYQSAVEVFAEHYPCVIATETISNLPIKASVNTNLICRALSKGMFLELAPDLVISVDGDYVSTIKGLLKSTTASFEHWCVNPDGSVVDQFGKLTAIFECSAIEFFSYSNAHHSGATTDHSYRDLWQSYLSKLPTPNFPYSSAFAMQAFLNVIPAHTMLHYGNGVAVHIAQYFPHDPTIRTYCHSGTTTIDGSLSTFIGQAAASSKLCFAFIGDLSFFYDMNAIWNRHIGPNVRILLYNNEGGQTFHWNAARGIDTLAKHTSAEHFVSAKGWVESNGFAYLSAHSPDELCELLPQFVSDEASKPICLEVFTKKEIDGRVLHEYYDACRDHLLAR